MASTASPLCTLRRLSGLPQPSPRCPRFSKTEVLRQAAHIPGRQDGPAAHPLRLDHSPDPRFAPLPSVLPSVVDMIRIIIAYILVLFILSNLFAPLFFVMLFALHYLPAPTHSSTCFKLSLLVLSPKDYTPTPTSPPVYCPVASPPLFFLSFLFSRFLFLPDFLSYSLPVVFFYFLPLAFPGLFFHPVYFPTFRYGFSSGMFLFC